MTFVGVQMQPLEEQSREIQEISKPQGDLYFWMAPQLLLQLFRIG